MYKYIYTVQIDKQKALEYKYHNTTCFLTIPRNHYISPHHFTFFYHSLIIMANTLQFIICNRVLCRFSARVFDIYQLTGLVLAAVLGFQCGSEASASAGQSSRLWQTATTDHTTCIYLLSRLLSSPVHTFPLFASSVRKGVERDR